MQPYTGSAADITSSVKPVERTATSSERLHDLLNVLIILNAYVIVLLLIPPQHEYPVMDDWIYAGSAQNTLNTGVFVMPDWSQANLIGVVYWGVLWTKLFGFSITVLTYSVLVLAVCGLIAFYGILRELNVPPWGALLGTLMLGFHPIYLHLSYSFMTDVPFLAVELIACYFLLRGITAHSDRAAVVWLIVGSLFAGWAFLMRQFGLLIPVAFLAYFVMNSLATRRFAWKRMLPIVLVFAAILAPWYAWARTLPMTWALASQSSRADAFLFKPEWPQVIVMRSLTYLIFVAIFAGTAVKMRRRSWFILPVVLVAMLVAMFFVNQGPIHQAQLEPPFTMHIGPIAVDLPQDEYTFGLWGSVVRPVGLDFDEFSYTEQQIWSPEVWHLLWGISLVLAALLVTSAIDRLFMPWWKRRSGQPLPPALPFYLLGAGVYAVTAAYIGDIFLRYSLGFMPFVIFFVVSRSREWGRLAWPIAGVALALLVTFSVLAQADNVEHNNVRWEAGHWMEARAGAVRVGWNWAHWGHQDSETYAVSDVPIDGFRIERSFPYTSRLSGFTTRYVLAQSRADMPPLPTIPKTP